MGWWILLWWILFLFVGVVMIGGVLLGVVANYGENGGRPQIDRLSRLCLWVGLVLIFLTVVLAIWLIPLSWIRFEDIPGIGVPINEAVDRNISGGREVLLRLVFFALASAFAGWAAVDTTS